MLTPLEDDIPEEKPVPKRGRKPNVAKADKPSPAGNTDSLAKTLQGLHVVIAMGLALPELAISEDESKMQADAIQAVMREYEIPISPATQALVNLAFISFALYAPRIQAIRARLTDKPENDAEEGDKEA